ncbi:MAG: response regulator [Coleofasciculaceae cyanobacterium]
MLPKPLNQVIETVSGKVPLRAVLVVPFVVQIVAAVGLTGYLSFRNGQQAVEELAGQLMGEISDRIEQNLQTYLDTPHQINQTKLNAVQLGFLNMQNLQPWEKYLWQQVQLFPYINFTAVSNKQGEYRVGEKMANGSLLTNISGESVDFDFHSYNTNENGDRTSVAVVVEDFDIRQHTSYQDAAKAGKPTWSSVYVSFLEPTLIISALQPVYEQGKELEGVLITALRLDHLGRFLNSLKIGKTGQTFIIDREGKLVATSTEELPFRTKENQRQLIKATDSHDLVTQETAQYLATNWSELQQIKTSQQLETEIAGKPQFLQVVPFQDSRGLDLLIVVVVPEADFMKQIYANTKKTIFLCLIALLLATTIGIITSRWISRPVLHLSEASRKIAKRGFKQPIKVKGISELQVLAESFNKMGEELEQFHQELEQKVQERTQALAQAEEKYRSIFENAMDGIFQTTVDGQYLSVNPALAQIYGYQSPVELISAQPLFNGQLYVKPNRRAEFFAAFQESNYLSNFESRVYRYDGSIIWISETVRAVRDAQGKLLQYEGMVKDISTQKQAEVELKKSKKEAEKANRAKSNFIANMSHELRSPLNAILGFTQLMRRSQNLPTEHQESVSIISHSGEHLLTLINNVLDLSKLEAGQTTLNEKNFDLYHLVNDIEDMFCLKASDQGLQLLFECSPDVPRYVRTDEIKLRQVLINLLSNALKFTEAGGVAVRVVLGDGKTGRWGVGGDRGDGGDEGAGEDFSSPPHLLTSSPPHPLTSSPPHPLTSSPPHPLTSSPPHPLTSSSPHPFIPSPPHQLITFEVEDTGPGVAAEELDKLFEVFGQTQAGKDAQEGTGIGLPLTRSFVRLMGGEITVNSEVGQGSIFKFELPVKIVSAADIESKQPRHRVVALEPNQPHYRILIVDDKAVNRQLLVKLLSPLGFEVKETSNGKEAIEVWEKWEPHLIWMDMRMPVLDGYQATKQIKSHTKGQATAIIALTASVLEEERAVILSAGCDDFLRKPFREEDIFTAMHKHLGVRYLYEDQTSDDSLKREKSQLSILTTTAISTLPVEWRVNLKRAILQGDLDLIAAIILQIRTKNEQLALVIEEYLNNFEYDKVLSVIPEDLP